MLGLFERCPGVNSFPHDIHGTGRAMPTTLTPYNNHHPNAVSRHLYGSPIHGAFGIGRPRPPQRDVSGLHFTRVLELKSPGVETTPFVRPKGDMTSMIRNENNMHEQHMVVDLKVLVSSVYDDDPEHIKISFGESFFSSWRK